MRNKKHNRTAAENNPIIEIQESLSSPKRKLSASGAMRLAADYSHKGEARVAQVIYSQLMDQCPTLWQPAVELLKSFHSVGHDNAAQLQAYRMLAMYKYVPAVISEVAHFYQAMGETDRALKILTDTIGTFPEEKCLELFRAMAFIYENEGQLDKAVYFFNRALATKGDDVLSLYGLVNLEKKGAGEDLLIKLLTIESTGIANQAEVPHLHFALAYLYEKSDPQKYFHHLTIGNNALAQDSRHYLDRLRNLYQNIIEHVSADLIDSYFKHEAPIKNAPIFIVAPPRSGTTLLEKILGAHPSIHAIGESSAFSAAINRLQRDTNNSPPYWAWDKNTQRIALPKLDSNYYSHSRVAKAAPLIVVDKSIENIEHIGLILLTWPQARIIRLKRHPLDTILSCYHQLFAHGYDHLFDLESLAKYYILVQKFMDLWQSLFPDNIITMEYEALISEPEQQIPRVLESCGLAWSDDCLNFNERIGAVLTASNLQVRRPIYKASIGKWKKFYDQLLPAIKILDHDHERIFDIKF